MDKRSLYLTTVRDLRRAIRWHRDQKGDDRCWLDDFVVWAEVEDGFTCPTVVPTDAMARCVSFYRYRRSDTADPVPPEAILDPYRWDDDLGPMTVDDLRGELDRITAAVIAHRDIEERPRTIDDDRALYAVLPERIPADFRLPPEAEFLGEARQGAGCPAFWKSHGSCPGTCHNFHQWGPCSTD